MSVRSLVSKIRYGNNFDQVHAYFQERPSEIESLIRLMIKEKEYPYPEYSSWIIVHICKAQKEDVVPYRNTLIDFVFICKNESARRNVLNIIKHIGISNYRESELIELLIDFIKDYTQKVAVQVYSMYILIEYIKIYPELKDEIGEIIHLHSEKKTPAYGAAKRNFFKKTAKI